MIYGGTGDHQFKRTEDSMVDPKALLSEIMEEEDAPQQVPARKGSAKAPSERQNRNTPAQQSIATEPTIRKAQVGLKQHKNFPGALFRKTTTV